MEQARVKSPLVFPKGRFCWHREYAVPGESLWSLTHKFAIWNCVGGRDIKSLMRDERYEKKERQLLRGGGAYWDLFSKLGYDENHLCRMFGDASLQLIEKSTLAYLRGTRESVRGTRRDVLRFCPKCFALGLHFTVFQEDFLLQCPAHKVPLITGCPRCRASIEQFPPDSFEAAPYQCRCGHTQWNQKRGKKYLNMIRCVVEKVGPAEDLIYRYYHDSAISVCLPKAAPVTTTGIPLLVAVAFGVPPPSGYRQENRVVRRTKLLVSMNTHGRRLDWEGKSRSRMAAVYLRVRRSLYRLLRNHRKAIRVLEEEMGNDFEGTLRAVRIPRPCDIVAAGFVLWRLFWERKRFPERIVYRRLKSLGEAIEDKFEDNFVYPDFGENLKTERRAFNFEVTIRYLDEALRGTFYECLAIADLALSMRLKEIGWCHVQGRYVESIAILRHSDGSANLYRHRPIARRSRQKQFERLLRFKPTLGYIQKMKDCFRRRRIRLYSWLH